MPKPSVLFYNPKPGKNTPVDSRLRAYRAYFESRGIAVSSEKGKYILISTPLPHRYLMVFLLPKLKIILDVRDGWSIAQEFGYGGTMKPKPFKAKVTRLIERFIARRSYVVITCTHGLQKYLQKNMRRKVLLIPNGISEEDYDLAHRIKLMRTSQNNPNELVFCCAGKFSEYGEDKVKKLCHVIIRRYKSQTIKVQLIGSNEEKNRWVGGFLCEISNGRARLEFLPRMNRKELYRTIVKADYGLTIVRDSSYEFGTKVYDYIALGLPVVNYFDKPNNFTRYFDSCLDYPFDINATPPEIRRLKLISDAFDSVEL